MAEFAKVLEAANAGYSNRDDYPPFAMAPWDDRNRWIDYLKKVNDDLDAESAK